MLPTDYRYIQFALVTDTTDFFRAKLPEIRKIKSMIDSVKLLLSLPHDRVILSVAEGERIYKLTLLTTDINKTPFAEFIYMPMIKRLDLVSLDSAIPLIQWLNKKPVFKGYSMLLDKAKLDKLFDKIISNL